jgi:hypothetical protein
MPLTHFVHAYFVVSSGEKKIPTFNQYISSNSHLSGKGNGKNLLTNMQQQQGGSRRVLKVNGINMGETPCNKAF